MACRRRDACVFVDSERRASAKSVEQPQAWGLLVAAFGCILGSTLLTFLRWYLLVRAQRFDFRLADAIRLGFLGLLFNYVGPGAVGGDIVKAWFLARQQASRRTVAVTTVLLDRVLGLLALFVLGAVAAAIHPPLPDLPQLRITSYILWGDPSQEFSACWRCQFPR